MICFSPVGYGVELTFPALALCWSRVRAAQTVLKLCQSDCSLHNVVQMNV